MASLTGGVDEGMSPLATAKKELKEESGYDVGTDKFIPLGTVRGTKSSSNLYHLFAVNLTNISSGEAIPEGELEKREWSEWRGDITDSIDPLLYVSFYRLDRVLF
jgi:8-oxo-dGTP pyrophosphatase MutT (NUDIX family)